MAKLKISCKGNAFNITIPSENKKNSNNLNLTQTNIINTDSMIFTTSYIYKNIDIVASFLGSLAIQKNVNKVVVKDTEIASLVLLIIQNIKEINEIEIKNEEDMTYEIYERLLFSPNMKKVTCYNLKPFMLEQLDKKNLDVTVKREIFFISKFMEDNKLTNYSSIYYKRSLIINNLMEEEDLKDLEIFCKTNKYLKVIDLFCFSKENVRKTINILARSKKKNIKINIIQNDKNIDDIVAAINFLKLVQEKVKKEYNYTLNIVYSNEYRKKNMWSQLTINNIKVCCFIVILMIIFGITIIQYNSYKAFKNIDELNSIIQNDINKITEGISSDTTSSDLTSNGNIKNNNPYVAAYKEIFKNLKEKNEETVGYLKINNTTIDYPIVKTKNNKYYLTNDFNKKKNTYGWIFMDYRNNEKDLNENTIIYGHNSHQKIMFGTLNKILNEKWYKNETNQIIIFNTPYYIMEWQIYSIYKIPSTNDFLIPSFETMTEYQNFINMVKERSIYDFNIPVSIDDRTLTISTCIDGVSNRAVLHAKLIKKTPIE